MLSFSRTNVYQGELLDEHPVSAKNLPRGNQVRLRAGPSQIGKVTGKTLDHGAATLVVVNTSSPPISTDHQRSSDLRLLVFAVNLIGLRNPHVLRDIQLAPQAGERLLKSTLAAQIDPKETFDERIARHSYICRALCLNCFF